MQYSTIGSMELDEVIMWNTQLGLWGPYHEIARHAGQSSTVHAVALDFSKAFNKVVH